MIKFLKRFLLCGDRSPSRETQLPEKSFPEKKRYVDNRKKNPFSSRGIDKFYDLLAEHERRKENIYLRKGSENIAAVRFVYSDGSDVAKPVVIRYENRKIENKKHSDLPTVKISPVNKDSGKEAPKNRLAELSKEPRYYLPIVILLILAFLAMFNRPSAVLSMFIVWYSILCFAGVEPKKACRGSPTVIKLSCS